MEEQKLREIISKKSYKLQTLLEEIEEVDSIFLEDVDEELDRMLDFIKMIF